MNPISRSVLVGLVALSLPMSACSESSSSSAPAAAAGGASKVKVKDSEGTVLVEVKLDQARIKLEVGGGVVLKAKRDRPEKRKYKDAGDQVRFVVKDKDAGFKVYDPLEVLVAKVKITPEKIKVSDNEQNDNALVIPRGTRARATLTRDGSGATEGELRRTDDGRVKLKDRGGNDLYTVHDPAAASSLGALAASPLPMDVRAVVFAELEARAR